MKDDFLAQFMGNGARSKLLRVFAFDSERPCTLKDAAARAGISLQAAAREIKILENWGVVKRGKSLSIMLGNDSGRKASAKARVDTWALDPDFKYQRAIVGFVREVSPIRYDKIVAALKPCGKLGTVVLSGTFTGDAARPVDILVAADDLSERRLAQAIKSLEPVFGRELRYAAFSSAELRYRLTIQDRLLRETLDFPHLVLLDKAQLL